MMDYFNKVIKPASDKLGEMLNQVEQYQCQSWADVGAIYDCTCGECEL